MAKVTLRLYNREIESLIDRGQVEEAIAHCKHILLSYPKHIETYRLLAKAFLECQLYGEASDIFERVLSAVPDDFISQVGMSIIREDEGNLDGAIWYMERAFEVQPSNTTVQDELKRLYHRRDGVELSRIRLTRGALARMYAKGDLYQQAIAEIRGTLVTEPVRPDLQVLLARMCFQAGQRIESTEICSELLSKYPFCFEANRLLSQILPNTTRAEDAKIYLQRIYALDPYSAFLTPTILSSKDVPENSVTIDHLDYKPGAKTENEQPGWASSLGLIVPAAEPSAEPLPEWLSGLEKPQTPEEAEAPESEEGLPTPAASAESEENLIPNWMKSAGWVEASPGSSETTIEPPAVEEPNELSSEPSELAPAEIPDWLQEIAPSSTTTDQNVNKTPAPDWMDQESTPDWLREPQPVQDIPESTNQNPVTEISNPASMDELPDWLKAMDVANPIPQAPMIPPSKALPEETQPDSVQELPQWLQDLKTQVPSKAAQVEDSSQSSVEFPQPAAQDVSQPAGMEELPDWLSSLADHSEMYENSSSEVIAATEPSLIGSTDSLELPAQPGVEIPDWLQELGNENSSPPQTSGVELTTNEDVPQIAQITSNEVSTSASLTNTSDQPSTQGIPSAEEQDAALAWLEGLAAQHGAEEETLYVKPEDRIETPPVWVQQASAESSSQPAETVSSNIPETTPGPESLTAEAPIQQPQVVDETEAALAWLESLAAKQGADEETLYVKPEDRTEVPPDWVQKASEAQAVQNAFPSDQIIEKVEEFSQSPGDPQVVDEHIATEVQISGQTSQETTISAIPPISELPQWVQDLKANQETVQTPVQKAEIPAQPLEQPIIVVEQQGPPVAEIPVSKQLEEELPEWLQDLVITPEVKSDNTLEGATSVGIPKTNDQVDEIGSSAESEEKLPDWLQEFEEPTQTEPAISGGIEETPPWLEAEKEPEPAIMQMTPADVSYKTPPEATLALPISFPVPIQEPELEQIDYPGLLHESQMAINEGNIDKALHGYNQFVNKGLFIDETIHDLRDALYRFPVDISIWQVLGDAYVRSNRLQDALDAFTKAEELLR